MALTRRQREVLDFITDFIRTRRYSPSLEEIAAHFGLSSVATVHKHVANLEKKGFIRRSWNRSRSIDVALPEPGSNVVPFGSERIREPAFRPARMPGAGEALRGGFESDENAPSDSEIVRLPLAGRVAAGHPVEAIEDRESIGVPGGMTGKGKCYVLQVEGESMIGEHIQDGDYVIVEERRVARDGERVIALIEGQDATLKIFHREPDGSVRLDPANPNFEPIRVRDGEFMIQGVVIGVMRKYRH